MRASDLGWFGLQTAPFTKEISDDDLWLPTSKVELVDDLAEAIEAHATVLLTGEPGVGKTCVLRALRRRLSPDVFRLTYCHNATLGRRDFYRQLCVALGLVPSATAAGVFYAVSTHVEELGRERVHPVFLLDEAHLLHQDVLDHLHILLNYQWDSRALLSLVLVGLPELESQLERRRNRSLYSRIHHRFAIEDATADDIAEYVAHRLKLAGADKSVFGAAAVSLMHEHATGALRDIDRIAYAAMRDAARRKRKTVDRDAVERVLAIRPLPNACKRAARWPSWTDRRPQSPRWPSHRFFLTTHSMVINTTTASSQHRDDHCGLSRLTATAMPIDYAAHDAINELSRQQDSHTMLPTCRA